MSKRVRDIINQLRIIKEMLTKDPPKNKFKGKDGEDYGTFVELETANAEFQEGKLVHNGRKH